ncbi:hypothetical protein PIB30_082900 [Stylosanthes scabra]|uniref:Putative plant transposon protein domain-containing protein n=1 Tax=Stylosanthes scabra TaxID=79078 RepID=A0ABU6XR61_9FABA|nr:hypothetical protein [Stylosanthes scabra]
MSSSSSYYHNEHLFRAPHHQEIYQKYIHRKGVTPEKSFELQEGQYPEVGEQIRLRGWRRLNKPRIKISKDLVHEFYTNAVRNEEELASEEDYPYTSFVRGKEVNFSATKIREVLRIKHMTLGTETDFKTRQYEDQRLNEVIREICMPGAQWKMSSSQPPHPIQLRRLCKEAGVPMGEFKNTDQIQIARPITAKAEMHYEAAGAEEDNYQYQQQPNFEAYETNFQQYKEDQQQGFQFLNEQLASMKIRQEQFFENMKKAQSQYLEELKSLRTMQDEMVNQQNNFYRQIKREHEKTIKEIEEVKKFQVNQTLMGARKTTEEKLEERIHETRNEIIEMRKLISEWTRNASSREGYYCCAHQQANPNLVKIPPHKIPDFLHSNVANKKDPYFGALKSDL